MCKNEKLVPLLLDTNLNGFMLVFLFLYLFQFILLVPCMSLVNSVCKLEALGVVYSYCHFNLLVTSAEWL